MFLYILGNIRKYYILKKTLSNLKCISRTISYIHCDSAGKVGFPLIINYQLIISLMHHSEWVKWMQPSHLAVP